MISLNLKDLVCGYGTRKVTGPLTCDVSGPSLIAVTGENGSGKSTLLKTICGYQRPLSGTVTIDHLNVHEINDRERARKISLVGTGREASAGLDVISTIALGRFAHRSGLGFSTHQETDIARKQLFDWNLGHLASKRLFELSDGEYQRVMILRGLVQEASVLVLDEPTAFLDYKARAQLMKWLSILTEQKKTTVIFSTHDLNLVREYAQEIWHVSGTNVQRLTSDIRSFNPESEA
ncbi:MAG: hypothetical protein RL220_1931 [Bacteroidota bacterium]